MKIEKLPAQDFKLESKTNGVISGKVCEKLKEAAIEKLNGDAMTEDSLLVEAPIALKNGKEDYPFGNGSKTNDSISPFNSPLTYPNFELDELSSDEMTLHLSDDDEQIEKFQNEHEKRLLDNHIETSLPSANSTNISTERTDTVEIDHETRNEVDLQTSNDVTRTEKINESQASQKDLDVKEQDDLDATEKDDLDATEKDDLDATEKDDLDATEKDDLDATKTETEDYLEGDLETPGKDTSENTQGNAVELTKEDDLETAKKDLENILSKEPISENSKDSEITIDKETLRTEHNADLNKIENNSDVTSKLVLEELVTDLNTEVLAAQSKSELTSSHLEASTVNSDSFEKTITDLQKELENSEQTEDSAGYNVTLKITAKRKSNSEDNTLEKKISKNDTSEETTNENSSESNSITEMGVEPINTKVNHSDDYNTNDETMITDSEILHSECESPDEEMEDANADVEVDKDSEFAVKSSVKGDECVIDKNDDNNLSFNTEVAARSENKPEEMDNIKVSEKDVASKEEIKKSSTSLKRSLDNDSDIVLEVKKPKINGILEQALTKDFVKLDKMREFFDGKEIRTMTRAALEELCLQKMSECINHKSEIGELNLAVKQLEQMLENWRNKSTSFAKQIRDLEVVQHRFLQEVRVKSKESGNIADVNPIKITRSVGLQVSLQAISAKMKSNVDASPVTQTGTKRKVQRNSLPIKLPTTPQQPMIVTPISKPTPAPSKSPQVPQKQAPAAPPKGIKTILPKVLSGSEVKEVSSTNNNTLLGTYLQNGKSNTASTPPAVTARKSTTETAKVIDLTDEDDSNKTATSAAPASTGNIRVMAPHQLNTSAANASNAPIVTSSMPRLTYLVQAQGQQGQPLILTTAPSTARSANIRPAFMFKQLPQGQAQSVPQRLNIVRPANVSGPVTVVAPTTPQNVRPTQHIRFAPTSVAPTAVTRTHVPTRFTAPRHPAPLPGPPPVQPSQPNWKAMPPRPSLKISRVGDGIVLSWKIINKDIATWEEIASYQLYAYQETNAPPSTDMWRKVGDVKALALPMACTLTQFTDGNKYHFAVRAVDIKSRVGPFSQPEQISLP